VRLADLDGDVDLDAFLCQGAVVPNSYNTVMFRTDAGGLVTSGQRLGEANCRVFSLVDLDGDGDLDAVVTRQSTFRTRPQIYPNDGAGGFRLSSFSRWHGVLGTAFDAADVNGDGNIQLIGASFEDCLEVSR